jgi:hypothetical protein
MPRALFVRIKFGYPRRHFPHLTIPFPTSLSQAPPTLSFKVARYDVAGRLDSWRVCVVVKPVPCRSRGQSVERSTAGQKMGKRR